MALNVVPDRKRIQVAVASDATMAEKLISPTRHDALKNSTTSSTTMIPSTPLGP